MTDYLTAGVLKRDVTTQIAASREVLDVVRRLQKIAETEPDAERKTELTSAVRALLDAGGKIVHNAREMGRQVARIAGA